MGVHNVLNKGNKVLRHQIVPAGVGEEGNELGGVIVAALDQPPPGLGELQQGDGLGLVAAGRLKHRALPVQRIAAGLNTVKDLKIYKIAKQKYFVAVSSEERRELSIFTASWEACSGPSDWVYR